MKKSLFLFAILMLTFCVSAFSQNYEQKRKELLKFCKTKVLAEDLDSYIRRSTSSEIAVTIPNVTDQNIIEVMRAINCSKKPVSIVLSANQGFTKIPDNFLYAGDSCYALKNIILPSNLKSIGAQAFFCCFNLEYLLFQGKKFALETIGHEAFAFCGEMKYLELPASLKEMDLNIVSYGCRSLESITIPSCVTVVPAYTFCGNSNLKSIIIPRNIKVVEEAAFYDCSSLSSVVISEGVINIGEAAFSSCSSLTSVTIPESVTKIENDAFTECTNLTIISILGDDIQLEEHPFYDCPKLEAIYVTKSIYDQYHHDYPQMKIKK